MTPTSTDAFMIPPFAIASLPLVAPPADTFSAVFAFEVARLQSRLPVLVVEAKGSPQDLSIPEIPPDILQDACRFFPGS